MFALKILLIIIAALVIIALFYYGFTNRIENLEVGKNIEEAYIKKDLLHVSLDSNNLKEVKEMRFVFLGEKEYYFKSNEIKYSYSFTAEDLGIESLDEIEKVSAVLEY